MVKVLTQTHLCACMFPAGASYDLLHRNCCHFCVDLAARLGVGPVPGEGDVVSVGWHS